MFFCYGVFVKILNLWKPSKRNPSQKFLQNTLFSSVCHSYTFGGITDSVSTDLVRCKQGLPKDVIDAARMILQDGKAPEIANYFQKKLIDPGFLKSDEKSAAAIVSLFLNIIENDSSISASTVVNKVSDVSKKDLLTQRNFILSEFLAGIFLYAVSNVDNRRGRNFSAQITEDFIHQFPQRDIYVLLRPALPKEPDKAQLSPEVEELIRSCNHVLYNAQNRMRVYGFWDELDFDSVYIPPYLNSTSQTAPSLEPEDILSPSNKFVSLRRFRISFNQIACRLDSIEPLAPLSSWSPDKLTISERQKRIGSIFDKDDIIYVVGGAGYGKSLFLKNLCVNPGILKSFNERPLLIIHGDIKRLIRPDGQFKTMMEFLKECFSHNYLQTPDEIYPNFLELCLNAGRCLILLDALDEVGNPQRSELHHLIVSYFENTYPHNKVCITSRERGFIPRINITCFYIAPISINNIKEYVDQFISLKKFNADEKSRFIEQASILVDNEFIKGFLTLSLLLAIYKNEQQLPTNKLQLYQKCFEYMATHREKDKNLICNSVTGEKYDWTILLRLMSDATFMELARLSAPNNADIPEDKIKKVILSLYQMKFDSEGECHSATKMFLQFCADRTEVFIPSPNSNLEYRFFHRSFYEYFYAKSIYVHTQIVSETYKELWQFDVDSEIFELLLTIYDLQNPSYLRALISYAFEQAEAQLRVSARELDILIMMMQVVDERDFIERFILLFLKEGRYIERLPLSVNFQMISTVIKKNRLFFQENLYANQHFYLLAIQSWLICDFFKKESCYRALLLPNNKPGTKQKSRNNFAYCMLLNLLPNRYVLLDDWFHKFSNAKYLLGVKKLRSHQAMRLAAFAKELIDIEIGNRWEIYDFILLEM